MWNRFALVAAATLLVACQGSGEKKKEYKRSPELDARYKAAVKEGVAKIGMTRAEVEQAIGKPLRKDTVKVRDKRYERWNYTFSELHFDRDGYCVRMIHP